MVCERQKFRVVVTEVEAGEGEVLKYIFKNMDENKGGKEGFGYEGEEGKKYRDIGGIHF